MSLPRSNEPRRAVRMALLAGVYLLLTGLLAAHQLGRVTPDGFIDELTYGRVAQNIAAGLGFTYEGVGAGYRSLYPYAIAPAWALFDGEAAYRAALLLNAAAMHLVVVPAYLIARRVASWRWALAAAAGAALTPSMVWSGYLMTEALAYPVTAVALWGMIGALRSPRWHWPAIAIGAALLAGAVRTQLLLLVGAFALAVLFDLALAGRRSLRSRVSHHRWTLGGLAGVGAVALAVAAAGGTESVLTTYTGALDDSVDLPNVLWLSVQYLGVAGVVGLLVPLVALLSLAASRDNRRDPELGPILCVGAAALLTLIVVGGWSTDTISPELRERYVFYATPVLAACWVALPGRARPRTVLGVSLALVVLLAVAPGASGETDTFLSPTVNDLVARLPGDLDPLSGSPLGDFDAWAAFTAVLGALTALALCARGAPAALMLAVPALAFGVGVTHVRQADANAASEQFRAKWPIPPDWIEQRSEGPVALVITSGSDRFARWHLELWNPSLDRVYRLRDSTPEITGLGQVCPLDVTGDGELVASQPCGGRELPRVFAFQDEGQTIDVVNGRLLFEGRGGTRLFEVPDGRPRLRAPDV